MKRAPPVTLADIRAFAQRIADEFRPRRIIFGSHASGTATADSDVDLLVTFDGRGSASRRALEILLKLEYPGFALDLLTRTEAEIRRRLSLNDSFIKDVLQHGKVVYEADAGVGRKSGGGPGARGARGPGAQARRP